MTATQLREVVGRLRYAGQHTPGDPVILIVFDAGYDVTRLAFLLADLSVELLGRLRWRSRVLLTTTSGTQRRRSLLQARPRVRAESGSDSLRAPAPLLSLTVDATAHLTIEAVSRPREECNDEMRVEFVNGNRRLVGSFFFPSTSATPGPGLLFVHGLHSDQAGYALRAEHTAAALGAVCLTFDLSGHGQSAGVRNNLAPSDHAADVIAAFDVLIGHKEVEAARIGICGASYGAYLSALVLPQRRVRKLLLRAPALYDDEMFNITLAQPRKPRADVAAPRLARTLREFSGEVLLLESGADETIPHSVIEWYLGACPIARHKVIEGASHALTTKEWREVFLAEIVSFFHGL